MKRVLFISLLAMNLFGNIQSALEKTIEKEKATTKSVELSIQLTQREQYLFLDDLVNIQNAVFSSTVLKDMLSHKPISIRTKK